MAVGLREGEDREGDELGSRTGKGVKVEDGGNRNMGRAWSHAKMETNLSDLGGGR